MQIKSRILLLVILILIIFSSNFSFATNSRKNNEVSQNTATSAESNNEIENELVYEHMDIDYPDIEKEEVKYGSFTVYQIIAGAGVLLALVGTIAVISLYARSREDELDEWQEYEEKTIIPEKEEPKAMEDIRNEMSEEEPKAVKEMEDRKKIEEIKKSREFDRINNEEKKEMLSTEEDTNSINYKHQKALDDFYKYAEEIKNEGKQPKRGKGKHSR